MSSEQILNFGEQPVGLCMCKGEPWFKASDITTILLYKQCSPAIAKHVSKKYVRTLQQLQKASKDILEGVTSHHTPCDKPDGSPLYIPEPGVYELAFGSKKPEAIKFREWVVEEILPEIRKTGRYVKNKQLSLMNEKDLHVKVVDFMKKYWPESNRIAGLGELQDSINKRIEAWQKGYSKGQPDLIILNKTKECTGLVIELKTPLGCGRTSPEQQEMLIKLKDQGFETLVSEDYDEILLTIVRFMDKARAYTLSKDRVRRSSEKISGPIKKTMTAVGSIPRVVSQSFSLHSDFQAMEPAAKRARSDVAAFNEVVLEGFTFKQLATGANGKVKYSPMIKSGPILVNLTPDGWLSTTWGFDFSGRFEKPSFLGGPKPEKEGTPEGLKIEINLGEQQVNFLNALDEAAQKEAASIFPKAKWSPLVNADKSSCKVKVILKGDYDLCKLSVVKDGKVHRDTGHEFLRSFNTSFLKSEVKLVLKAKHLWSVSGSAGLSLEATQLVLKPSITAEADAFGDDSELLA